MAFVGVCVGVGSLVSEYLIGQKQARGRFRCYDITCG